VSQSDYYKSCAEGTKWASLYERYYVY